MPVDNVSTYSLHQNTLSDMARVESTLAQQQMQLSSGYKSQDFAGMAAQVQQFLSMDGTIGKIDQYLNDNQQIAARIDTTSSIMDQFISTATNLQNLIQQRRNASTDTAAFFTQLQGIWQTMAGQMNTSLNGHYLFSGTKTDVPPIDASQFPAPVESGVPDDSYYHGSKQDITVRVQDSVQMTYNVRADSTGFQKIFAGIAMAKQGDANNDDEALSQAYDLVQSGLKDVISTQATVNANKVALSQVDQNHQSLKLYWQGLKESVANTDVVSVSTQVAVNQGILQASFQAFAKITSLKLSDYLK